MHAERSAPRRSSTARRATTTIASLLALAAAAIVLAPAEAHAFCRTRTVPVPVSFDTASSGCWKEGALLYHASQCVPYHLLATASPEIPTATLSNTLSNAFGAWTSRSASCTPGITTIELAPVNDTKVAAYTNGEHGHNVIGVVEGPWPHGDGADTLALATLTFDANTGEVFDADLELRSDIAWSFTATAPKDGYDLQAVLTHEAGHFLGLAHSPVAGSAMFATYEPGSISQRTLDADDQAAICAIYPDRQTRVTASGVLASTACDLSPGAAPSCSDPAITHGCSVGPRGAELAERAQPSWLTLLGALGAVVVLARRSRRSRARIR